MVLNNSLCMQVVTKELLKDPVNGKKALFKELFDLPPAILQDIVIAPLLLPRLPSTDLKQYK